MRGLFVTGTDTGVGKTVLSGALAAAMADAGQPVRAYKPVLTGVDHDARVSDPGAWPPDHELLASAAGMSPDDVAPLRYGPAASPHLAAALEGAQIGRAALLAEAHAAAAKATAEQATLIVEGVGGLLVPLADDYTVCDLAHDLQLPLLIAARPGLGSINHTLLTLKAARTAQLEVRAVVLTPWPAQPTAIERSNRETIVRMGEVEVETLAHIAGPGRGRLARAGDALPWRRWLEQAC
jgi:dethiobiotin synthetase